jgi:hypothetical protein
MVRTIIKITITRHGSPARGMFAGAFALLPANLNLAIFHVVRRLMKKLVERGERPIV